MTRAALTAVFLALATVVSAATLPPLPASEFVDTEVSTNGPLSSLGGRHGEYTFSLSFNQQTHIGTIILYR